MTSPATSTNPHYFETPTPTPNQDTHRSSPDDDGNDLLDPSHDDSTQQPQTNNQTPTPSQQAQLDGTSTPPRIINSRRSHRRAASEGSSFLHGGADVEEESIDISAHHRRHPQNDTDKLSPGEVAALVLGGVGLAAAAGAVGTGVAASVGGAMAGVGAGVGGAIAGVGAGVGGAMGGVSAGMGAALGGVAMGVKAAVVGVGGAAAAAGMGMLTVGDVLEGRPLSWSRLHGHSHSYSCLVRDAVRRIGGRDYDRGHHHDHHNHHHDHHHDRHHRYGGVLFDCDSDPDDEEDSDLEEVDPLTLGAPACARHESREGRRSRWARWHVARARGRGYLLGGW